MNKFMLVSVLLLLVSGCSQQQYNRRSTSIPEVSSHASTNEACKTSVPYEEEKQLLATIPEENKVCTEATVQAIEKAKHAAEVAFGCGQKETYKMERVLGRDSTLASIYMIDNITLYINVADKALKNNCLDIADKMYRSIIGTYIPILMPYDNTLAQSLNDRAKIGVDDVRVARNQVSKK